MPKIADIIRRFRSRSGEDRAASFIRHSHRKGAPAVSKIDQAFLTRPDLARRRTFFRTHVLIQTHVPKTGGSALAAGIAGIVGGVHALDRRLKVSVPIEEMSPEDLDDIWFLSSHMGYGQHVLFDRVPLYFAAVRDPVDRAVSYYRYLQNRPNEFMSKHARGLSFEDSWHAIDAASGLTGRNLQCRKLIGFRDSDPVDEDILWRRVSEGYFLIIPHHRVDDTIHRLRAAFGVFKTPVAKVNVSRFDAVEPSPAIVAAIREANALDARLYERIVSEFDGTLERASQWIASQCLQSTDPASSDARDPRKN